MEELAIGRIVHYVGEHGDHRAAVIVEIDDPDKSEVTLYIFPGTSEFVEVSVETKWDWQPTPKPGTWHWPEREERE